jgi:hypothetical protein
MIIDFQKISNVGLYKISSNVMADALNLQFASFLLEGDKWGAQRQKSEIQFNEVSYICRKIAHGILFLG